MARRTVLMVNAADARPSMTARLAQLGGVLLLLAGVAGVLPRALSVSVPGAIALLVPALLAGVGIALLVPFAWSLGKPAPGGGRSSRPLDLMRALGVGAALVGATALVVAPFPALAAASPPFPPSESAAVTTAGATFAVPAAPVSAAGAEGCPASIQALVDAAPAGSTVRVPACLYRETVSVRVPLTLEADPGAEIRGSDRWTSWTATADGWDSSQATRAAEARGVCIPGTGDRCHVAQQAFRDGVALRYVPDPRPAPDAFTVLDDGRIRLGADPAGSELEVSVRELWVHVTAPDVVIDGFTMRHSMVPAQAGGITVGGYGSPSVDRVTIRNDRLADAHGALVSIQGGSEHAVVGSTLERGGQLGLHLSGEEGSRDWLVEGNLIRENAGDGFDVGWESGGLKTLRVTGLRILDNEFAGGPDGDNGRGAWTDTATRDVEFRGNVMHGNGYQGAMLESSHGLEVIDNVAWGNGWAPRAEAWAWGGGIVLSSSDHAEVRDNIVAWNADGISVVSQERGDDEDHVAITVADNTILVGARPADPDSYAIAWVQDWPGILCDPASGNTGAGNRVWLAPDAAAFAWCAPLDLAGFGAVPGGTGTTRLGDEEAMAIAASAGVPWTPGPGSVAGPLGAVAARLAAAGLLLAAAVGLLRARRPADRDRQRERSGALAIAGAVPLLIVGATAASLVVLGLVWILAPSNPRPVPAQVPH